MTTTAVRFALTRAGIVIALVASGSFATVAAQAEPAVPPAPVITAAGAGPYGGITGIHATPGGYSIQIYVSSGPTCSKATSGPGVRTIPGAWAGYDGGDTSRFFVKPSVGLVAGEWVYGVANGGGPLSDVGPCIQAKTAEPMDAYLPASTPTTATLSWRPMADATSYTVRVMRRSAVVLRTIEVGNVTTATIEDLGTSSLYRFHVEANTPDGPGDAAWTPSMTALPFITVDMLTDQQFHDFEGRSATQADIDAWYRDLYDGKPTVPGKIAEIAHTRHWAGFQSPVIRLYRATFGRWPDKGGLDYWSLRRRQGVSLPTVAAQMTGSSEFQRRYGDLTNRAFVKRIYLNVLGRSADSGGLDYWTSRLDRGVISRAGLVLQFSEGSEHVTKTAAAVETINIVTGMLRRMPTAAELSTWAGATPPPSTELIKQILGSDAYVARLTD